MKATSRLKYPDELVIGDLVAIDGYMVTLDEIKHFPEMNCTQVFFIGQDVLRNSYSFNDNYPVKVYY